MYYSHAIRAALEEEMERDESVILIGEDIAAYGGAFGVTRGLVELFGPQRVVNTPISECGFVGMAVGAALAGMRPVVEVMFMDFIGLASDPLVNQAAKLHYVFGEQARCPLVLRTPAGGGRCYGPTHSQDLTAWFLHVPGIRIAVPATPADAKGLLKAAIRDDNPVLFVEHKMLYGRRGDVPADSEFTVPFGKARVAREGTDITIVAWSWMAAEAEAAATDLAAQGVSAEVIDLRTLAPLDIDSLIESVRKTSRVLIVEEASRTGGVAAALAAQLAEYVYEYLDAPIRRLAAPDVPIPASPPLEKAMLPSRQTIAQAAREMVQGR